MCERNKEMVWAHLNGLLKLALVARLLKTVPKWRNDGAEKILRLDETPNLQQSDLTRNFQSTTS